MSVSEFHKVRNAAAMPGFKAGLLAIADKHCEETNRDWRSCVLRAHLSFLQSRSDRMTVAVDFSPRMANGEAPVAERRLMAW